MTCISFISRYRRQLLLCMASALLHFLLIVWVGRELGQAAQRKAEPERVAMLTLLPEAAPVAAEAPPRPPPPPPAVKPRRSAPAGPAPAVPDAAAMAGLPGPDAQGGGAQPETDVESAVAPAPVVVAEEPPAAAAPAEPPAPRRFKVNPPPSADLTLDVSRRDADGTLWTGEAVIGWKISGERYRVRVEAGIRLVLARINLVVLTSEGAIGDDGFAPDTLTEKRRGRALTLTHFDQRAQRITFSASQNSYPLLPGTQDKATVPLQLAAIARADPDQLSAGVELMVGEDRDASLFRFVVLGQEEIETRLGKLQTWHLERPPRPGLYSSRLDIWLAPAYGWVPVQLRNTEASGALTTQTIKKIVVTDSGR